MRRYGFNQATDFTKKQINVIFKNAKEGNIKVEKWMMNRMYELADFYGADDNGSVTRSEQRIKHILDLVFDRDFETAQTKIDGFTDQEFESYSPKYQAKFDRNYV